MLKKVRIFRLSYCLMLLAACFLVGLGGFEPKVSAPLLTIMGGLILVTSLLPESKPSLSDIGVLIGTLVIIVGSYLWYHSAVPAEERDEIIVILGILVAFYGGALALAILLVVNFINAVREWWGRKRSN